MCLNNYCESTRSVYGAPRQSDKRKAVQRVPINIVHGEIVDFLKSGSGKEIKFYISFKHMILFVIGEKIKKIHQRKPEISSIW